MLPSLLVNRKDAFWFPYATLSEHFIACIG